ncbi:hypothetical protein EVAR_61134_1 [Eumeta japonica]|uniref:Uncharacterized protein n=1 Tax=Eumeta variegata TaxID=151549 RepID=A0A4C2ABE0_EUMVA|nr:hypothetical protein EVAR_61134_1 [Eumeta japonica]
MLRLGPPAIPSAPSRAGLPDHIHHALEVPLYTSNVGVLPSFKMCALRIEEVAEIDTARIIARIARDRGTGRGHLLKIHRHDANSAVPALLRRCDVFAVEGLILFDVAVPDHWRLDGSPPRSRLLDDSTRVPSQLADIPNVGFLNNGYRNFRLAASTSSSVVANLLRCKLDCINRRDTRSVHPSVDDPRPYVCGLRQQGACCWQYATFDRAISSHFARTPHSELNAPCAVSSQPAFVQFTHFGALHPFGLACYASVLPAAVRTSRTLLCKNAFHVRIRDSANTVPTGTGPIPGALEPAL